MAFDPDAYLASKQSNGFDPDEYLKSKSPKITPIESAARGAAQGASFGFVDEVVGGTKALGDDFREILSPTKSQDLAKRDEFGRITNIDELNQDASYEKHRDAYRSNDKAAKEANPGYFTGGEIGGSIATAALPFGATKTLGQAMQTAGRIGVVTGLGQSEAKNAAGLIEDATISGGLGLAGGAVAKGGEKALRAIGKLGSKGQSIAKAGAAAEESLSRIEDPDVLKEVTKSAQNRIKNYWNPDVDPSWEEFADIARKNGIDPNILPESVKFGPDSAVSRATRNIAEGRYGEETLKRFNQSLDEVRGAYDGKIAKLSQGAPVDEVTAGKILRDSYDEGVSKFFDQMDFTHNSIINQVPDFRLTPASLEKIESALNGVEKFAVGRTMRGVTGTQRGQGQQLLNAVEAIRAGNGSYKQTVEALRDIGEAAFQSKNSLADVPVDTQKMRKLYNDLNEGLLSTVRSELGDDIADSLVANNKAMSDFFGDQSLISRIMGDKSIAPEKAFQSLIINGDTKKIEALKKVIPPERWEYLKGAVLENITKRDPEGGFTFRNLYNNMRSKKNALSAIFTPEELAENAGLVRLGDRFGSPVLSNSGTGASLSFQDLTKGISNLTSDALAIRNANKAVSKPLREAPESLARDVSPNLKSLPSKAAGVLAGAPYTSERPAKGPEKWVLDGIDKLNQAGVPAEVLEQFKASPYGREILIEASDASPGSVRMKAVLEKIRTAQGGQ